MPLLDYEDEIIGGEDVPRARELPPRRKARRRAWRIPFKNPLWLLFKLIVNLAVIGLLGLAILYVIGLVIEG